MVGLIGNRGLHCTVVYFDLGLSLIVDNTNTDILE